MGSASLPRLWCTAAAAAPIIAIYARFQPPTVQRQRTRILRWNWKTDELTLGSTTTLRFDANRCRLSSNGEFLLYHAKGG